MRHAVSLLAIVIALGVTSPHSASADICDALDELSDSQGTPRDDSLGAKVFGYLQSIWSKPTNADADEHPGGLYFTSASGFSVRPVCQQTVNYRAYLYYPIGLVVRRLGVRELSPGRKFALVEAEHGLRMYIKVDHLQILENDKTYFFADSLHFVPYCRSANSCSKTDKERQLKDKHNLHPKLLYAVSDEAVDTCRGLEVSLFRPRHRKIHRKDGSFRPSYLDACVENPDLDDETGRPLGGGWVEEVKIVTHQDYTDVFQVPIRGHYQRFSDSFISRVLPFNTSAKRCNEKSIEEVRARGGGGASANVDIYVFKLSATGEYQRMTERITELGRGLYIFYSTYAMDRVVELEEPEDEEDYNNFTVASGGWEYGSAKRFPIETIFSCDKEDGNNLVPEKLYLVNIHNSGLEGGETAFYARDFIDTFRKQESAGENFGEFAGFRLASRDGRKVGQFWKITGYFEYFRIRDAFRRFLRDNTKIPELVEFDAEEYKIQRNEDYFTHLLIAATTEAKPARR